MAEHDTPDGQRRAQFDVLALGIGIAAVTIGLVLEEGTLVLVGAGGVLLGSSTTVVTAGLVWFTGSSVRGAYDPEARLKARAVSLFTGRALEDESDREQDTGWLIGRLENVLVFALVYLGAYTALSIVFAAKSFVRREDIASGDTAYYLAGTLLNFTYSILIGLAAVWIVEHHL